MFCSQCGKEIGTQAKFCAGCGALADDPGSVAPPVSLPSTQMSARPGRTLALITAVLAVVAVAAIVGIVLAKGSGGGGRHARIDSKFHSVAPTHSAPAPQFVLAAEYPVPAGPLNPEVTVASVDGRGISREEFDHWLMVAGLGQHPPVSAPSPGESTYTSLLAQTMGFLLGSAWTEQDAAWLGITVTQAETKAEFAKQRHSQYKTEAAWQKFLATSGQNISDLELRVRLNLLSKKIQAHVIRGVHGSQAEQEAFAKFVQEFKDRLEPLTNCAEGFVVLDCSSYKPPSAPSSGEG